MKTKKTWSTRRCLAKRKKARVDDGNPVGINPVRATNNIDGARSAREGDCILNGQLNDATDLSTSRS